MKKMCSIDGCTGIVLAKGMCSKHYQRQYNNKPMHYSEREPQEYIIEGDICKIVCRNKKSEFVGYAIIDVEDIEKCRPFKWYFHDGCIMTEGTSLHHLIFNTKELIDHKDGDWTNNRKSNMRLATRAENNRNRKIQSNNTSGYKGVSWVKKLNKWKVYVNKDGVTYYLGLFTDKHEAAKIYNARAAELHGKFARLNVIKED